jgi:hypothetical protein
MDKQTLTAAANRFVQAFGDGAHGAIGAWREGGERLGRFAGERWDTAFAQSRAQLSAETRRNATNARKVFARYYNQGLSLSTAGATVAVDTVVQAAQAALQQPSRA